MLDSFFEMSGGGGGGRRSIPVFLSKPTSLLYAKMRTRMFVCLSVYLGCPEPHSPPLDPYILDTCDLFVLLCHMLGMSSIRVKFSGLLYIHARFQRGRGADPWDITIL